MRIHMVGIGGAGMSALARLYLQMGHHVSGSDASDSTALRDLAILGAAVHTGHDAPSVRHADLVVASSAIPPRDPELLAARERGIRILKHAQALGELFNGQRGIAVAGTHGKTTTTSMIAYILERCGHHPKFQVGGELIDLDTSARWGAGEWMIVEADEFDRRFLEYRPQIAVVTNVEPEHFEYYGSVAEMEGAFLEFLHRVPPGGAIVACAHEARLARLLQHVRDRRVLRYGIAAAGQPHSAGMDWWATDLELTPGGSRCRTWQREHGALSIQGKRPVEGTLGEPARGGDLTGRGEQVPRGSLGQRGEPTGSGAADGTPIDLQLHLPGRHNVLNALAALAVCGLVGIPPGAAARALAEFHGTRRRFQPAGGGAGVRVYEDYAHHPTEVRVNLEAARLLLPPQGRLWAVFQPHLHQRTEGLFDEFVRAFDAADRVLLTDVYSPPGREPQRDYRGSRDLVKAMARPAATYVPDAPVARAVLLAELRPGDIVVVMGAGPINALASQLAADLQPTGGSGAKPPSTELPRSPGGGAGVGG